MRSSAIVVCAAAFIVWSTAHARAATAPADAHIAYVPIDDRPANEQLVEQLAAICGAHLELPPQPALGHFQTPGDPAQIERWLKTLDVRETTAVVVSTDMLAYGGLVASRTSATPFGEATDRLRALVEFHVLHPEVPIYAFGTVMRLAPTATPDSQSYLEALTHYAQSAGAVDPAPDVRADIAMSRSHVPDDVFWNYIGSRARDLKIDEDLLSMASQGVFTALAITQDDAGSPDGLAVAEEEHLHALRGQLGLTSRVLLNPGTDEMGMVMAARAIEDAAGYSPSVSIAYPSAASAAMQDPLEYLPISGTIANIAGFLKMPIQDDGDFTLDAIAPD